MKRHLRRLKLHAYQLATGGVVLAFLIVFLSFGRLFNDSHLVTTNNPPAKKPSSTVTQVQPTQPLPALVEPIDQFHQRITKIFFGTYVTPQNSPIQPERFTGYHTGVDVEYGDVTGTVPVYAIANGIVTYSNWASGYGGVTVIQVTIDGALHLVLYGHLDPSSTLPVGTQVSQGQQIGILGIAYSQQTDGERRHLHFDILASDTLDLRGYVPVASELSGWIDPLSLQYRNLPNDSSSSQ
ncbi:MAG TPA: M23 family metallopeptidase [Candidatus Saccharimonadales bacterium]|nr:M23 family metallopeptidase [Candidatus Saccharimonadales bacterium]